MENKFLDVLNKLKETMKKKGFGQNPNNLSGIEEEMIRCILILEDEEIDDKAKENACVLAESLISSVRDFPEYDKIIFELECFIKERCYGENLDARVMGDNERLILSYFYFLTDDEFKFDEEKRCMYALRAEYTMKCIREEEENLAKKKFKLR